MKTKEIKLTSGIQLRDSRSLGCGIHIQNQQTKFMHLSYSSKDGFYINITGRWLDEKEFVAFQTEFDLMKLAVIEANRIL